ncbi:MAG: TlpA family protein disulfide reductase [Lewinellaceae bacterium]|nr:TlpA family protein disulfide reductase [Lewinellaceae bacterium]
MNYFSILFFSIFLSNVSLAGITPTTNTPFPSIDVKTLDGKLVNTQDYLKDNKITIVSFWATWCTPCKRELDAVHELFEEWSTKYNVQVLAITIDDARGLTKVPALVQSKGWEFVVLSDGKQELQQALGFQTVPQSYLLNAKGEIVYSHIGYQPGDELELEEQILSLVQE